MSRGRADGTGRERHWHPVVRCPPPRARQRAPRPSGPSRSSPVSTSRRGVAAVWYVVSASDADLDGRAVGGLDRQQCRRHRRQRCPVDRRTRREPAARGPRPVRAPGRRRLPARSCRRGRPHSRGSRPGREPPRSDGCGAPADARTRRRRWRPRSRERAADRRPRRDPAPARRTDGRDRQAATGSSATCVGSRADRWANGLLGYS